MGNAALKKYLITVALAEAEHIFKSKVDGRRLAWDVAGPFGPQRLSATRIARSRNTQSKLEERIARDMPPSAAGREHAIELLANLQAGAQLPAELGLDTNSTVLVFPGTAWQQDGQTYYPCVFAESNAAFSHGRLARAFVASHWDLLNRYVKSRQPLRRTLLLMGTEPIEE